MAVNGDMFRTSYFAVKDSEEFKKFCNTTGIEYSSISRDGETLYAVGCYDGIPTCMSGSDDTPIDINFNDELRKYVADGWAVIFMCIGYEKLRYLTGYAYAIGPDRLYAEVSLDDIYGRIPSGLKFTNAEY